MTVLTLIAVVVLAAPPTAGVEEEYLLAPKLGVFKSTARLTASPFFAAEGAYLLPLATRRAFVGAELSLSLPRTAGAVAESDYAIQTTQVGLTTTFGYRPEGLFGAFTPYGAAGPSFIFHSASVTSFGFTNTERAVRLGVAAQLGGEYALGPGGTFAEFQYRYAPIGFASTGEVNAGGFVVSLGYRFKL